MNKMDRREFVQTMAVAALPLVNPSVMYSTDKQITIGIIGAENSHTIAFGKLFNIDKKFPNATVKYVWGETEELARKAMQNGTIPHQVKDPSEMIGTINALIVDHRHAKFHLPAALPFIEAGIPTFIDKPFCYRASEGKAFLELARKKGTPVTSYSSIAHNHGIFELKEKLKSIKPIQVISTGTADIDSEHGGIFFYGVHMIEPLLYLFGENITDVKITRHGHQGNASIRYENGLFITLVFKQKAYGWETFVETDKEFIQLKPSVIESVPSLADSDMVKMFRTGVEPRSHQSILNGISILEALEKSAATEKWTAVEYQLLNK